MRSAGFWLVSGCTLLSIPLAAQQINPANQIRWPAVSGSGSPTSNSIACTAVNYGMPYTDITANINYFCSSTGWNSGGTGGAGVTKINGVAGAFTFTGAGVSCASTTCTFPGGSGGGVGAGSAAEMTIYSGPFSVVGDTYLVDSAPTNSGNGMLNYSGKLGVQATTSFGGSFNFLTNNNGGTPTSAAGSQINLTTLLNTVSTPQAGAGNIVLNANDVIGNNGAANVNITTATPVGSTTSNSGNINLNATGFYPQNSGWINLLGDGISIQDQGGGITETTNSGQSGATIALVNNAPNGNIALNAFGTGDSIVISAPSVVLPFLSTSPGCLYTDSSGLVHANNANTTCTGGGGGGSGTVGPGTGGVFAVFTGGAGSTVVGNSLMDQGNTNAGATTIKEPLFIQDTSGVGGMFGGTQGTAPSGVSGSDLLWADSTAGRLKMNNNNDGAIYVPGIASAGTSGNCLKLASNGIDYIDSGSPCPTSGAGFTPTLTADSGAGTGGSLFVGLVSGSNDDNGWINLTTGASPAGSNSGLITIAFGGTYSAVRKCLVVPASALAVQLGTNGAYVPSGTATAAHFVITGGATALPANTTGYAFFYKCGN